MSFTSSKKAATIVLALCVAIVATACAATATEPRAVRAATESARHDDVGGDSLSCKSGFVTVEGRIACN